MRWMWFVALLLVGCEQNAVSDIREVISSLLGQSKVDLPVLGPASAGDDGIAWHDLVVDQNGTMTRLVVARPAVAGPVPVMLWAPLAMNWKLGGEPEDGDRLQMEHLAGAGVAVVAYAVPGGWEDNATLDQLESAIDRFIQADGGLDAARIALEFALAGIPDSDPGRIWSGGQGAAGTLALRLAQTDRRVRAVVAFDPFTDMALLAESDDMSFLIHLRPELRDFLISRSPRVGLDRLQCPVLLYHDSLNHEQNFPSLSEFYLDCLRRQKDVFLMDNVGIEPEYTGFGLRTSRTLYWLEGLGRQQ